MPYSELKLIKRWSEFQKPEEINRIISLKKKEEYSFLQTLINYHQMKQSTI
jgi:hypothetical protein